MVPTTVTASLLLRTLSIIIVRLFPKHCSNLFSMGPQTLDLWLLLLTENSLYFTVIFWSPSVITIPCSNFLCTERGGSLVELISWTGSGRIASSLQHCDRQFCRITLHCRPKFCPLTLNWAGGQFRTPQPKPCKAQLGSALIRSWSKVTRRVP